VEQFIAESIKGKYPIPSGAHLRVHDGSLIRRGVHIARIERKLGQQRDITGGLPRVDELFEARIPKDAASIAEIDGVVSLSPIKAGIRTVTIRGDHGQESALKIQASVHIRVREGDRIKAGDRLTEGPLAPHDILRIMGTEAAEKYLLNEIQAAFDRCGSYRVIRLHGDCHRSNVLWTDAGPHFVDLDDCCNGPAIQDLWMLLSGNREEMTEQLCDLLEGYEEFASLDLKELNLIEALRSLRMMHYAAWLARRWQDSAFPLAFPWFNTGNYWEEHILELREQLSRLHEPALVV